MIRIRVFARIWSRTKTLCTCDGVGDRGDDDDDQGLTAEDRHQGH